MKNAFVFLLGAIYWCRRSLAIAAALLITVSVVVAQGPDAPGEIPPLPDINTLTPQTIFQSLFEPLYGILIIVFGYLSKRIPWVKNVAPFYRVLTFAVVTGVGFYLFGGSFWKIAATYLISTSVIYDGLLSKIKKPVMVVGQ